jgi:hypothetical protein
MSAPDDKSRDRLFAALEQAGWRIEAGGDAPRQPDALLSSGEHRYALEQRRWNGQPWQAVLRGLFADAVLQARAAADASGAAPLVVVAAARISDSMAAALADYQAAVAPDVAWGLLDDRGRFELHGAGLEDVSPSPAARRRHLGSPRARRLRELPNPFSDLGQWALKVLLAPDVDASWLAAPRAREGSDEEAPVRNVRDLARRSGISEPRASDVVAALGRRGFVERFEDELLVVRRAALLDAWRAAHGEPAEEFGVAFDLPGKDPARRLCNVLRDVHGRSVPGSRACLGLFAAADALGLGVVRGAPLHLLVEDASDEFLEQLGLHRSIRQADIVIRRPRFPECAFRGLVERDGVPIADALQCWLDVSSHPVRGREQADELLARLGLQEDPA